MKLKDYFNKQIKNVYKILYTPVDISNVDRTITLYCDSRVIRGSK